MTEAEQRIAVVAAARRWTGTPYHHHGKVHGVGVDCATLLQCVFEESGVRPKVDLPDYSPQWHLHRDEPHYIAFLLRNGCREVAAPGIGDIVVYKQARQFAHGGIIAAVDPLRIIHAFALAGYVLEGFETEFGALLGVEKKYFSAW